MYIIIFDNNYEIVFGEEKAKERYNELDELYIEVRLLKIEKEIMM